MGKLISVTQQWRAEKAGRCTYNSEFLPRKIEKENRLFCYSVSFSPNSTIFKYTAFGFISV